MILFPEAAIVDTRAFMNSNNLFFVRLPTHDSGSSSRKNESVEPAHILSRDFSMTVSTVSSK